MAKSSAAMDTDKIKDKTDIADINARLLAVEKEIPNMKSKLWTLSARVNFIFGFQAIQLPLLLYIAKVVHDLAVGR